MDDQVFARSLVEILLASDETNLRIKFDAISAQIACVTAGIADYAIIPAVYSELNPLRRDGRLYYSPCIGSVQLVAFSRSPGPHKIDRLAKLVEAIDHELQHNWVNQTHFRRDYKPIPFPSHDHGFFQQMQYGYYVDWPRGESQAAEESVPSWRWERVSLTLREETHGSVEDSTDIRPLARYRGKIMNSSGDEFDVHAELMKTVFCVRAISPCDAKRSVPEFISVFTWCDPIKKVIFGSWGGTDPDHYPAVFGTIWSHTKLSRKALSRIAAMAKFRSALDSDRDGDLDSEITLPSL